MISVPRPRPKRVHGARSGRLSGSSRPGAICSHFAPARTRPGANHETKMGQAYLFGRLVELGAREKGAGGTGRDSTSIIRDREAPGSNPGPPTTSPDGQVPEPPRFRNGATARVKRHLTPRPTAAAVPARGRARLWRARDRRPAG